MIFQNLVECTRQCAVSSLPLSNSPRLTKLKIVDNVLGQTYSLLRSNNEIFGQRPAIMGAVRITSLNPKLNGSHFGLPSTEWLAGWQFLVYRYVCARPPVRLPPVAWCDAEGECLVLDAAWNSLLSHALQQKVYCPSLGLYYECRHDVRLFFSADLGPSHRCIAFGARDDLWFSVVIGCTWVTCISDVREPISFQGLESLHQGQRRARVSAYRTAAIAVNLFSISRWIHPSTYFLNGEVHCKHPDWSLDVDLVTRSVLSASAWCFFLEGSPTFPICSKIKK